MKNARRALRRHHRQRMIARTERILACWTMSAEDRLQMIFRWYKNRQKCSCYMCGHRRKWYGPTMQERRQSCAAAEITEQYDADV